MGANVSLKSTLSRYLKPRVTNLDLVLTTHPCSPTFPMRTPICHRSRSQLVAMPAPARRYHPVEDHLTADVWSVVVCLYEATSRHRTHYLVLGGLMHARVVSPASLSRRRVGGRSRWLIRPQPHDPMVDHADGCIPAMRSAPHESRHASSQAFLRIPRVLFRGQRVGESKPRSSTQM